MADRASCGAVRGAHGPRLSLPRSTVFGCFRTFCSVQGTGAFTGIAKNHPRLHVMPDPSPRAHTREDLTLSATAVRLQYVVRVCFYCLCFAHARHTPVTSRTRKNPSSCAVRSRLCTPLQRLRLFPTSPPTAFRRSIPHTHTDIVTNRKPKSSAKRKCTQRTALHTLARGTNTVQAQITGLGVLVYELVACRARHVCRENPHSCQTVATGNT
jgi:hypothetical protein